MIKFLAVKKSITFLKTSTMDCHKSSDKLEAILDSASSIMENAEISISQIFGFLLFIGPNVWEEKPAPLGLSVRFSSDCKHDTIEMSTRSKCAFSGKEVLPPKSLLKNLRICKHSDTVSNAVFLTERPLPHEPSNEHCIRTSRNFSIASKQDESISIFVLYMIS